LRQINLGGTSQVRPIVGSTLFGRALRQVRLPDERSRPRRRRRLAKPAKSISVAHVVREAEGAILPAECFDATPSACAITRVCRLRSAL